jgi:hypothetical protein
MRRSTGLGFEVLPQAYFHYQYSQEKVKENAFVVHGQKETGGFLNLHYIFSIHQYRLTNNILRTI